MLNTYDIFTRENIIRKTGKKTRVMNGDLTNPNSHKRLVAGPKPAEPTISYLSFK